MKFDLTPKQALAYLKLKDQTTREIGYGGGAGGGKSILGCLWILSQCIDYPGTAWVIGRKELTNLKKTTLLSFFQVLQILGIKPDTLFKFNSQTSIMNFHNGSIIFWMDMAHQPSDPLYTRFGGLEITGAFVDESNENQAQSIEILKTRMGRCKNNYYCHMCACELEKGEVIERNDRDIPTKWRCGGCNGITPGLIPKLLETFNPSKNHVYHRYYKPFKEGKLPSYRIFITALATDNPYLDASYIEQLKNADKITKERLLYGNFEYDDDPTKIFEYERIIEIFTNSWEKIERPHDQWYLSGDLARQGRDYTVFMIWQGLFIRKIVCVPKNDMVEAAELIEKLCIQYKIPMSNIILDEDGVGGGTLDILRKKYKTVKGFINNSVSIQTDYDKQLYNYANLKAQCYFKLAEYVNKGIIGCYECDITTKDKTIEDLEQIAQKDPDKEKTIRVLTKEEIKTKLGRSTDFSDAMMMRMVFELTTRYRPVVG